MIARVEHHSGHLEWLLSLAKLLEIRQENVFLQFDSWNVYKSVRRNQQLYRLLRSGGFKILTKAAVPVIGTVIPRLKVSDIRRIGETSSPVSGVASILLWCLRRPARLKIELPGPQQCLLVNGPEIDVSSLHCSKVARFATPIAPNLTRKDTIGTVLVKLIFEGDEDRAISFRSPSLSDSWTKTLLEHSSAKNSVSAKPTDEFRIFLALRAPDTDNLTRDEFTKVIDVLRTLRKEFRGLRVHYRPHPRQLFIPVDRSNWLYGVNFVKDYSHPRVIAHSSDLTISLGGSTAIESAIVGTPVIEVVTSQLERPVGFYGQYWGHMNWVEDTTPENLEVVLRAHIRGDQYRDVREMLTLSEPGLLDDNLKRMQLFRQLEQLLN